MQLTGWENANNMSNDFYRNYQELEGGAKWGAENNFWGSICPLLPPPPGAATANRGRNDVSLTSLLIYDVSEHAIIFIARYGKFKVKL